MTVSSGGLIIGTGIADEGVARIAIAAGLPAEVTVTTEQHAPVGFAFSAANPVRSNAFVNALPVPMGAALPMPVIPIGHEPVGADPSVLISNILDGAHVTVTQATVGIPEFRVFDRDTLHWILKNHLDPISDSLDIFQGIGCERAPSPVLTVPSGPAPTPGPPIFDPPCPGADHIDVRGLLAGANSTIAIDNDNFLWQVADDATTADVGVPTTADGAKVTITQERCGPTNTHSETAKDFGAPSLPDLPDTPIDCAQSVRVRGAQRGAWIDWRKGSKRHRQRPYA